MQGVKYCSSCQLGICFLQERRYVRRIGKKNELHQNMDCFCHEQVSRLKYKAVQNNPHCQILKNSKITLIKMIKAV